MDKILSGLKDIVGEANVLTDEAMKKHTSFKIGGPARLFVTPESKEQIRDLVKFCRDNNEEFFILGNGSNLLVGDDGYKGIVIQLFNKFNRIELDGNEIYAEAGALLSLIANTAAKNSLTGFEAASGIPGTLGGAVVMNAGAYGFEMKDVVSYVRVLTKDGQIEEVAGCDMAFGYRSSVCIENEYVVLGAKLKLAKGDETAIRERMKELKEQRVSKQPLEFPSAGSTFKRPEGYFAGKLIMDAGLRGYSIGGAQVSEKHCGFVINKGNATAKDVLDLVAYIQKTVMDRAGVALEMEIKKLGV